ncbi:hypothetical protein [Caballeronia grimmiae]|uniref:Uncharacterized protein n=1 Tax=Caballeronia grimmiae TaxID=1071679 RepID=A0A069NTW1_9BURK|nr:hypothetical protein [Caballeronia grimmiae]KDR31059.1 hypothetical protein BG57_13730 [Caballeronia grimmiae]GGD94556.1 hypothetical protein GCM10010985_56530 [Caballeronia grimmiae]
MNDDSNEDQYRSTFHGDSEARDKFAAAAMQSLLSQMKPPVEIDADMLAEEAFEIANAMMKRRKRR